jgi:hypothetical protein
MFKKPLFLTAITAAAVVGWYFTHRGASPTVPVAPATPPSPPSVAATPAVPAAKPPLPLPKRPPGTDLVLELQAALGSADPVTAIRPVLEKLRALTPELRASVLHRLGAMLASAPSAVSHAVLREVTTTDFAEGQLLGNALVSQLTKIDSTQAAAWVAELDPSIHSRQFYQTIGRDWTEQDKSAAMAWINTIQHNMHNQAAAVEGLADVWGSQNLPELLAWGNKIEDAYVRGAALLKGAKILALTDPAAAAKLSLSFTDPISQRQGLESAITAWVSQNPDPTPVRNFVDQIQDPAVKSEAQIALAGTLARSNPPPSGR